MRRKTKCNRCGTLYPKTPSRGGELELRWGHVELVARLCEDCYSDMVDAYTEVADDAE